MKLAITVNAMTPFIRATQSLDGDGLLALKAYQEISTLHSVTATQNYPNVLAIAKSESAGNASNEQLLFRYAKNSVRPAHEYFKQKFDFNNGELEDIILAFKAVWYYSPSQLKPTPAEIDALKKLFHDSCLIHRLKE